MKKASQSSFEYIDAIKNNDYTWLLELLQNNKDVVRDALFTCMQQKKFDIVYSLISDLPCDNDIKYGLLIFSIDKGYYEVTKHLLEHGINFHTNDDHALRRCAETNNVNIAKLLLDYGANVHADNDSALREAVVNYNFEMVKFLVEHGADIHAKNDSALRSGVEDGEYEIVKFLLESGANISALNNKALVGAIQSGSIETIKLLLDYGVNLSSLHTYKRSISVIQMTDFLIEQGFDAKTIMMLLYEDD